jgi:hypothetical protein
LGKNEEKSEIRPRFRSEKEKSGRKRVKRPNTPKLSAKPKQPQGDTKSTPKSTPKQHKNQTPKSTSKSTQIRTRYTKIM